MNTLFLFVWLFFYIVLRFFLMTTNYFFIQVLYYYIITSQKGFFNTFVKCLLYLLTQISYEPPWKKNCYISVLLDLHETVAELRPFKKINNQHSIINHSLSATMVSYPHCCHRPMRAVLSRSRDRLPAHLESTIM